MNLPLLTLADSWRPFLDPIDAHSFWYLFLVPISFFIAVAYKAVRVKTFKGYWTAVAVMTVQIVTGMLALAVAFYLLVQVYPKVV
ncbi:MAG TPA: hypothetical protein VEB22_14770 [Phycisphaerales bacterium]|nr:hypothetical protein [Phycisphaerales bacterium]